MMRLQKATKQSLPWVVAIALCFVVLAATIGLIAPQMHTNVRAAIGSDPTTFVPSDPLSKHLVSALAMLPAEKKEVGLIASMIENHLDARPQQSGLRDALVVYELIVEGDISRFLALFHPDHLPDRIGPIRSLRPHFIALIRGYRPLLLHAGGSQLAYDALAEIGDIPDHDAIRYDGETYSRDPAYNPPHNLFMRKAPLLSLYENTDLQKVSLPLFPQEAELPKGGEDATEIMLNFGSEEHNVHYRYTPLSGLHIRPQGGIYVRSIQGAERQAVPANVIVLEAYIEGYNQPGYIPWTQTFGEGKMVLFRGGKAYEGIWKREKGEPFRFLDAEGNGLPLAPGQVWITMLPSLEQVEWE